jgi:hypothetical protein
VVMSRSSCGGSNDDSELVNKNVYECTKIERMVPEVETFNRNIEILTGLKVRKTAVSIKKILNYGPLIHFFLPF